MTQGIVRQIYEQSFVPADGRHTQPISLGREMVSLGLMISDMTHKVVLS